MSSETAGFDLRKLYQILGETTQQLRKGDVFEGTPALVAQAEAGGDEPLQGGGVLEIYAMPSVAEAPDGQAMVDLEFIVVGVDRAKAAAHRDSLVAILNAYPSPERLAAGPSYIEVGGELGDQGAALQLFALGETLGLWKTITPASLGFAGAQAREMAGMGWVMITGYRPTEDVQATKPAMPREATDGEAVGRPNSNSKAPQ